MSFALRVSTFVLLAACGAGHTPDPVVEPLPPSPSSSSTPTTTARTHAPDRAEVLAFCERYRLAMEARDANALMALVSPRYVDDDNTYATLATSMKRLLAAANQIKYEIRYGDVATKPDGLIEVDYHYTAAFLTASGWQHRTDDAKLVLERHGESFRVVSGM